MAEGGSVESTLNFLMRCERGRRNFQVTLTKLRLFDYVTLQRSSSPTVSHRIVAQGAFVISPADDPVFVDGQSISAIPLEVMLQFAPAGRYGEGRRELGRMEYLQPRRRDQSVGSLAARLSLELLLPMEFVARFTDAARIPVISVDVSGIESSMLDAEPGKGTRLWDTGANPSLVVERCIVADPEQ